MCTLINCPNNKISFNQTMNNSKCPVDSTYVESNESEKFCCHIQNYCACKKCESKIEVSKWCQIYGNNFEAVLIQKGESIPGNCCDIYICRKTKILF